MRSETSEPTTPDNPQQTPASDPSAVVPTGPQFAPASEPYPAVPQAAPEQFGAASGPYPTAPHAAPGQFAAANGFDPAAAQATPGVYPRPTAPSASQPTPDPGYGYGRPEDLSANPAAAPVADGPENVGRGIGFSLLAIVLGAALSAAIFQLGFIASITSFAMAWGACWLYAKGAGAPPKKGVVPLIAVIVVGVIISLFAILSVALYSEIAAEFPTATFSDIMPFVLELLFDGEVWGNFLVDAGMYVVFAALGTFTILRQLGRKAEPAA